MKRVIFSILLFLSVFILPWYINVLLAFIGIFIYPQFYEFIVVAVIMYATYRIPSARIIASPIWFPLIVSVTYISIQFIRSHLIVYKNEI